MATNFIEIDAGEVQRYFPGFYGEQGRFFEVVHQGQPIGFVGIRTLGDGCELEAFIFKQYRNALTKGVVLAVLDLPKPLGFKRCWMQSSRKTVVKLLNAMGKYGIMLSGPINRKCVFVREFQ